MLVADGRENDEGVSDLFCESGRPLLRALTRAASREPGGGGERVRERDVDDRCCC